MSITKGANVPTPNGPGTVQIEFTVTAGGRDCGTALDMSAVAQEKITSKYLLNSYGQWVRQPDDIAFSSGTGFYLSGNKIIDLKGTNMAPQDWAAIPINTVFYTFTQTNRLIVQDCCTQALPPIDNAYRLQRRKVSATEWQLEITP